MYKSQTRINFYDTDPGGVLFYGNLFKIIHSAYEQMLESFNLTRNYFIDPDFAVPIIRTNADYFHPMRIGDLIDINISVTQLKSCSFELTYEMMKGELMLAEAKTVHLFVKKERFEKTDLPDDFKKSLEDLTR